ncbi:TetR family transcriptional regulator [Parahaliea aestuarii]|uniref:Helix-turn-helix transcriptional regulator n=1 Tax=Parahaliea aestuarii TaxID=1852021 RepID=A0A5C9A5M1_9GAMM|nr:TetR family transcriptional regulator [Parahaliea aestuarii]TXS94461.1 helix-turn-helix transcriptional regulator [Parahaliea aestuarii]
MDVFKPLVSVPMPAQARSQQALERFLAAGEGLLAANRFEEAGVAEIAREARSSVGTFYRLLEDKERLLLLLLQRFLMNVEKIVDERFDPEAWADKSLEEVSRGLVGFFVQLYKDRRGVLRALILQGSRDPKVRDRIHVTNDFVSQKTAAVLRLHRDEINHPKPDKAARFISHMVLGALNQHTITGNFGTTSQRELTDELGRVFLSYLSLK